MDKNPSINGNYQPLSLSGSLSGGSNIYHTFDTDLVIVGGGMTGVCASISAKRMGIKCLIIEKNQFFGGMATGGWVHSMLTFHGKKGDKIIAGIPEEIIQRGIKEKITAGHIRDTIGVAYSVTPFDPGGMKLLLHRILEEEGVDYILNGVFIGEGVEIKSGKEIGSVLFETGGRLYRVRAKVFIDASGDGVLGASCGIPFYSGRDGEIQSSSSSVAGSRSAVGGTQPMSLMFRVHGVDFNQIIKYIKDNPCEFHNETVISILNESPAMGVSGFFSMWREAKLSISRDRLLFYRVPFSHDVIINSTRITGVDAFDPVQISKAYLKGREQVYEIFGFLKNIPGFENIRLYGIAPLMGVREVRRLEGVYTLAGDDLKKGRRFEDEVVLGGFPIDIHSPCSSSIEGDDVGGEGFYGIPYRCFISHSVSNLLFGGKCFSADFYAHASARVQATCMGMGQALGIAGAMSIIGKKSPLDMDINQLKERIRKWSS